MEFTCKERDNKQANKQNYIHMELTTPVPAHSLHASLRSDATKLASPTEMEQSLTAVFQKCAWKDGNKCNLSKTEFLSFMNTDPAAFTKNKKDPSVWLHDVKTTSTVLGNRFPRNSYWQRWQ